MHKLIFPCLSILVLVACTNGSGPYSYPGYYQPAQQQTAYMTEGSIDGMGNYHPPVQKGGQYLSGRWYRAQPGNPGPSPQKYHAFAQPLSTPMGEIGWMSADGDVASAPTCLLPGGC